MEKKDWKKELRELSFMKGYYFKLDDNGLVKKKDDQLVFNREELEHFIEQELDKAREEGRKLAIHEKRRKKMSKIGDLDIKLREALQKDFEGLYVKEYTTDWKERRLSRNIELKTMKLDNLEKYVYELLSEKAFTFEELVEIERWYWELTTFQRTSFGEEVKEKLSKLLKV